MRRTPVRIFGVIVALSALTAAADTRANWLTHIAKEAGEVGGKAGTHAFGHLGPAGKAAAHLGSLGAKSKTALAVHATPEGHWQFVNKEGQSFTAGTVDEMQRVVPSLLPDAADAADLKLTLYLSDESLFRARSVLDELPPNADLNVMTDHGVLPLRRDGAELFAVLRPNLAMKLVDERMFREVQSAFARKLAKAEVRTLSFAPGTTQRLSNAPKFEAGSPMPSVDFVDPANLDRAFRSLRTQTAVVTGRVDGRALHFAAADGAAGTIDIAKLTALAREHDVSLLILKSDTARQAGSRNWLWQKMSVGSIDTAARERTFGDFFGTLSEARGGLVVEAAPAGQGRVQISVVPDTSSGASLTDAAAAVRDMASDVAGDLVVKAAELNTRDQEAESELSARIIPGIPTYIQMPYIVFLVLGLLSWSRVRGWWRRLVPVSDPRPPIVKRSAQEVAYLALFTPLVGPVAFIVEALVQAWNVLTAPFRWAGRRLFRRRV